MSEHEPRHLTETEIEDIVKRTVHETLTGLGLQIEEPQAVQRDFAWVRDTRRGMEKVGGRILMIVVTVFTTGTLGVLGLGLVEKFGGPK